MTINRVSTTRNKEWNTPDAYCALLKVFWGGAPELDPCANSTSTVHARIEYRLPDTDGLMAPWSAASIYVNPPYGYDTERHTHIRDWLLRCSDAAEQGSEVIALVPVATNTKHWQTNVFRRATSVCFIAEPRVKFSGLPKGAPMAVAFVYWGKRALAFRQSFAALGRIVSLTVGK